MKMSMVHSTKRFCENSDSQQFRKTKFLDLRNAFDLVDQKMLINKLMKHYIKGKE